MDLSDLFAEMTGPSMAMASALALTAGAYVNAKLGISSDMSTMMGNRAAMKRLEQRIGQLGDTQTIYKLLERVVGKRGATEALWFEHKTWTYAQLKDLVDRIAALLHARGYQCGDVVSVFMTNSPEMLVVVYALAKLGVVAGLVNTSLRDDTFLHCLNVSNSKAIISTPDLSQFVCADMPHMAFNISSFNDVSCEPAELLTTKDLEQHSPSGLTPAKRTITDLVALIYTSGTTGKPKACGIRNFMPLVTSNPQLGDLQNPSKYFPLRIYSPLPLFHGTAFFMGLCYSVSNASTLCLRRKFSASQFWKDVHDSRATRILYIGELCRYLLSSKPTPYDRNHSCIVASGNGLRSEIWEPFRQRFGVPEIREFYRSTEGIAKFDNHGEGIMGAGKIGFRGPIRRFFEDDTLIVKYDPDTEMPYRDPQTGFCVPAALGEEGEAIGRVANRSLLIEYLHNEEATEKKLIRDVFKKGDLFQRAGDLVVCEPSGWVKFQDRVGDTFRWKGENVSAGEVRDHICRIPNVHDAVVFGVKLGGYDGQAGAAGITMNDTSSAAETELMKNLYGELKKKGLPSYAAPRLVRLMGMVTVNATFKQLKGDLVKKSWDPRSGEEDKLYWLNGNKYEKLDESSWSSIQAGQAKL